MHTDMTELSTESAIQEAAYKKIQELTEQRKILDQKIGELTKLIGRMEWMKRFDKGDEEGDNNG